MDFPPPHDSGVSQNDAALQSVVGIDAIARTSPSQSYSLNVPGARSPIQLPPIETADFVSGRHEVNPAIALTLIQDIHKAITQWRSEQRAVISAMRVLYAQGPMVDGWLQSSVPPVRPPQSQVAETTPADARHLHNDATILRHGDADALMEYVASLEGDHSSAPPSSAPPSSAPPSSAAQSQYWLCCLGDDGSVHSQLCPPEQMATVGTAIARFQQFKQLKLQQQTLAAKLQRAVDMLTDIRNQVCG